MRKIFLLLLAMLLSLATSAAVKNITPTTPYDGHDNLRLALYYAHTEKFDTIILADGTYVEKDNYLFLDTNMVIMAAEGAHPVIEMKAYAKLKSSAKITIKGLKFEGSAQGSYSYYIALADSSKSCLILEDCEFANIKTPAIQSESSSYHTDSCKINNCYFHDGARSAVYFKASSKEGNQLCNKLIITNSTFANYTTLDGSHLIDIRNYGGTLAADFELKVDQCTFYNYCNSEHPEYYFNAVYAYKSTNATVKNCIFANPSATSQYATYMYGGTVDDCITYNTSHRDWETHPTITNNRSANPLIKNAAKCELYNASPARRANGTICGDPRWAKTIDTIAAPATLMPVDALLSDSAGVVLETSNYINFKARGSHKYNDTEWAKWTINVTKVGEYAFNINANNPSAGTSHKYTIRVYEPDNEANPVLEETTSSTSAEGDYSSTTNKVTLAKKTYVVKVWNPTSWSVGNLVNVKANYLGGETIAVPDTLWPVDALRSENAQLINGAVDSLTFARLDHEWEADDENYTIEGSEYVKWNINIAKDGKYQFVANTFCKQGHNYRILLYTENEGALIDSWLEKDDISEYDYHQNVDYKVSTPVLDLTEGKYVLKMQSREYGRVMYVAANYEGGSVAEIPGQILGADAIIYDNGNVQMFHNGDGDLEYGDNETPNSEYAYWNINATEAGTMSVTLNLDADRSSGHNYRIELYDGNVLKDYSEELESTAPDAYVHAKGNVELTKALVIPSAGTYTLRLLNRAQYSTSILHGITFTPYVAPAGITMSEDDENNDAWADKIETNLEVYNPVNVTMGRTIIAGMYNTLCLPFPVSSTQCKAIFGNDVELLTMDNATLSGDILTLTFNDANDIWQGTPVLIKTSGNIVNPTFEGVTIRRATPASTTGDAANFRGTFFPTTLDANRDLFVGQNNTVHFPSNSNPLKGLRAYFHVTVSNAQAVKRARIVANEQVITEIDLVNGENAGVIKTIENGQLIISIDGIRFNVMGTKIQ